MLHKAALEVCGLIRMPGILLGKSVNHADDFWQELLSFSLVRDAAEFCNRSTCRLLVKAVGNPPLSYLADAFFCCFMVCHKN